MMIASILTWARTLQMRVKFLTRRCGFVRRGMNGECDKLKRREVLDLEEFSWLDLPADMVNLIISKLRIVDEAKLACVCKGWRDIIQKLPPIYPLGKSPLLIHLKSRGEGGGGGEGAIFHYYSPLLNKTFQLGSSLLHNYSPLLHNYSPLRVYEIISAKDGILLLVFNQDEMQQDEMQKRMVVHFKRLVVPFSGYTCLIPSNLSFNGAAIGFHKCCCVLFVIDTSDENQVIMHVCLDMVYWSAAIVYDNENKPFYLSSNPVYFDGRFYCLDSKSGSLGVFDVSEGTWDVYSVEFMNKHDDCIDCCCCCYLVAWIDTVMAVQVKNHGSRIRLFLLDREKMVWEETDDLCGRSLYLGSTLSAMSMPTAKKLQNRVFLPHCHHDDPKAVIVAQPTLCSDLLYFRAKPFITRKEKSDAETTTCCCNNSGEESEYLGSTQNQKYCTIWYQPFCKGLNDWKEI